MDCTGSPTLPTALQIKTSFPPDGGPPPKQKLCTSHRRQDGRPRPGSVNPKYAACPRSDELLSSTSPSALLNETEFLKVTETVDDVAVFHPVNGVTFRPKQSRTNPRRSWGDRSGNGWGKLIESGVLCTWGRSHLGKIFSDDRLLFCQKSSLLGKKAGE